MTVGIIYNPNAAGFSNEFTVTFLEKESKIRFNHDGDKTLVQLNSDNSLKYEVKKKVKMIIPSSSKIKKN